MLDRWRSYGMLKQALPCRTGLSFRSDGTFFLNFGGGFIRDKQWLA